MGKCGWPRTGSSVCSHMQVNESGTFQELLTKVLQHSWSREWRVGATDLRREPRYGEFEDLASKPGFISHP